MESNATKPSAFNEFLSWKNFPNEDRRLCHEWVYCTPLTDVSLLNLASILIVYDYCVPVQMVMQMAMGAMQVCVSVQTLFFLNLAIYDSYSVTLSIFTSLIISFHLMFAIPPCPTLYTKGLLLRMFSD